MHIYTVYMYIYITYIYIYINRERELHEVNRVTY